MEKLRKIVLKMYFVPWKPEKKNMVMLIWSWFAHISRPLPLLLNWVLLLHLAHSWASGNRKLHKQTPLRHQNDRCPNPNPRNNLASFTLVSNFRGTCPGTVMQLISLAVWASCERMQKEEIYLLGLTRVLPLVTQMKVNHLSVGDCLLHLAWQW